MRVEAVAAQLGLDAVGGELGGEWGGGGGHDEVGALR